MTLFEKTPILQAFGDPESQEKSDPIYNQLNLWDDRFLDSTTIDLCLSLFPWAKFRRHKAAVKMHTLLDLHGNLAGSMKLQVLTTMASASSG